MPTEKMIRVRVDTDLYEALSGDAAVEGITLSALVRRILTAHAGASASTDDRERNARYAEWLTAVTDTPDKAAWRHAVDATLRKRGVDLPPMENVHEWASAVHPHTRLAKTGPTP